jgi:hypothetical protein
MNIAIKTSIEDYRYFFIAVVPVLALYDCLPLINWGYLFLLFIIFAKVLKKNLIIEVNIKILLVMVGFILSNFFIGITKYPSITSTINNTMGMFVFTVLAIFFCCPSYVEIEKLYKVCKVIGVVATIFLIYQYFSYNILDTVIMGNIPFLSYSNPGFTSIEHGRPTSFFYEPAHYIIYIAPVYAMSIIKKDYWLSVVFVIGAVLSTSTSGIVLLFVIPLIIGIKNSKTFIITSGLSLIGLAVLSQLSVFTDEYLSKLGVDSLMENTRIFGTLSIFQYFSTKDLIFGIGFNRLAEWLDIYGIAYGRNYANSIVFIVFSFGIIGLLLFVYLCVILYRNIQHEYRVMWFILLFISASDQIFFNRSLLYLLIWIYACYKKPDDTVKISNSC